MNAKSKIKPGVTLNFFGEGYSVLRYDDSRIPFDVLEKRAAEIKQELELLYQL